MTTQSAKRSGNGLRTKQTLRILRQFSNENNENNEMPPVYSCQAVLELLETLSGPHVALVGQDFGGPLHPPGFKPVLFSSSLSSNEMEAILIRV